MGIKSDALDSWRTYFHSANSNIFDVIEYAILVAASDYPKEFRLRRASIAEKLFSSQLTRCFGEEEEEDDEEGNGFKESLGCNEGFDNKEESKGNSSKNDVREMDRVVSNYTYDEAEALSDEIEEESQTVREVLRIKGILENHREEVYLSFPSFFFLCFLCLLFLMGIVLCYRIPLLSFSIAIS